METDSKIVLCLAIIVLVVALYSCRNNHVETMSFIDKGYCKTPQIGTDVNHWQPCK